MASSPGRWARSLAHSLRISVANERQDRLYLYNGKEFTLYAQRLGYCATAAARPTVKELADRLDEKYGISVPLEDLFLWGTRAAAIGLLMLG